MSRSHRLRLTKPTSAARASRDLHTLGGWSHSVMHCAAQLPWRLQPASSRASTAVRSHQGMVLGSDPPSMEVSSTVYGLTSSFSEEIDLLQTVPNMRDTTLEERTATTTRGTFSAFGIRTFRSTASARPRTNLRACCGRRTRHVRSQYHPDEKYVLPPTVQNDIGWGLTLDKYKDACAKYQEGAEWHGRVGSHITKFSERLLLGARHHLSGPMTNPKLHY